MRHSYVYEEGGEQGKTLPVDTVDAVPTRDSSSSSDSGSGSSGGSDGSSEGGRVTVVAIDELRLAALPLGRIWRLGTVSSVIFNPLVSDTGSKGYIAPETGSLGDDGSGADPETLTVARDMSLAPEESDEWCEWCWSDRVLQCGLLKIPTPLLWSNTRWSQTLYAGDSIRVERWATGSDDEANLGGLHVFLKAPVE